MPAGYHHQRRRAVIGQGRAQFERVAAGLLRWDLHRRAGLVVPADALAVAPGVQVRLQVPLLPVAIPCRVVYVVDEPNRRGFAYGTLPGHPESGEELFFVEIDPSGAVWFGVRAFSRGGRWYTRVAGPIGWAVQRVAVGRYLRAAAELAIV